jgi:hypothetical protein
MLDDKTLKAAFKGYGGVFRWGSGLLGKSAIVVGPLVAGLLIVAWSFHSDSMKLAAMILSVGTFFFWYMPFLKFCDKHPAEALLDGIQWSEHHQMLLAAKGHTTLPSENTIQIASSAASASMPAQRNGGTAQ